MDEPRHTFNGLVREPLLVDCALIPSLEQLPMKLRTRLLLHDAYVGSLVGFSVTDSDIDLINSISFTPQSEDFLRRLLLPHKGKECRSSSTPIFCGSETNFCVDMLNSATGHGEILDQDKFYPLAWHIGSHRSQLAHTTHPLLAILETAEKNDASLCNEKARVAMYFIAMAQRWFTAARADTVVRLWVVSRQGPTVKIFWADVERERVATLRIAIHCTKIGSSEPGLWIKGIRDRLMWNLTCIWEDVIARAPVENIRKLFPVVERMVDGGELEGVEPRRLTTLVVGRPKRKSRSPGGRPSKRRQTDGGVE